MQVLLRETDAYVRTNKRDLICMRLSDLCSILAHVSQRPGVPLQWSQVSIQAQQWIAHFRAQPANRALNYVSALWLAFLAQCEAILESELAPFTFYRDDGHVTE
jgi:hypothetical protein